MSRLGDALGHILADLSTPHALVGGLAVSIRTEPRFTRDVDLVLAVTDDKEAEGIVSRLAGRGYRVQAQVEQEATGRLATVRLVPPGDVEPGLLVDLLFASSGIEREVVEDAEPLEVLPGLTASVARAEHLAALKLLARDDQRRPQDIADLRALLAGLEPAGLGRLRALLSLIHERGYARDKDLPAELESVLAEG